MYNYYDIVQRNYGVYSKAEQDIIKQSKIAIVGIGCDGGLAAMILTRIGIGKLTLIDPDIVEISNLNRQPLCTYSMLGEKKVYSAVKLLQDYNPFITIKPIAKIVNENSHKLLKNHDVIIQCVDNYLGRVCIHRIGKDIGVPVVSMTGQPPYRAHVSTFLPNGIEYERIWNLPSYQKRLNNKIKKELDSLKNERAKNAQLNGASSNWANSYIKKKNGWGKESVGWGITPERAYLTATIQVHETINLILNRDLLAKAPKAVIINLLIRPNIVKIIEQNEGKYWNYKNY